jgi:ABC-type glycerol-3-phosphate transport system permease component
VKPALAVVAFFAFTGAWNAVIGPLIYIKKRDMYTLALGINLMRQQSYGGASSATGSERTDWAGMMAGSAMVALPVVVMFYFTQRMFIEGITFTGMKG